MPTDDEVVQQQNLLGIYRRTLAIYLAQRATLGAAYAPPGVLHGIEDARQHIAAVKQSLRGWGVAVADLPNDVEAIGPAPATMPAPSISQVATGTGIVQAYQSDVYMDYTSGDKVGGDKAHTINDFSHANLSGSIVNVGSTLSQVGQTIGALADATGQEHVSLAVLVQQVQALLATAPPDRAEEVARVERRMHTLVEEVGKVHPDSELVAFSADSLQKTTASLSRVLPTIAPIVTEIVVQCMRHLR